MNVSAAALAETTVEHLLMAGVAKQRRKAQAVAATPTFRGANLEVQTATDRELVASGPAGTGKSMAILYRMHLDAEKYPRSRQLILRKTRASLTESGLVTFEEKVLPWGHPALMGAGGQRLSRKNRSSYDYPNGASIVVGGMDEATRLYSSEYDRIYWQEATEGQLEDWQSLLRALRNDRMPFRQLIGDCNPQQPLHWLKARAEAGGLRMVNSTHRDNPFLWNDIAQDWTPAGAEYVGTLERLTGVLRSRLLEGIWAAAEGIVYEGFQRGMHLIPRFEIPREWRRIGAVDFGYTNPSVFQLWAVDPDGRMYLEREIYRTATLASDLGAQIKALVGDIPLEAVVADHDAEDRATLYRAGVPTRAAIKEVGAGIQKVQARLRLAGDGRPRLFLLEDAVGERDRSLVAAHRPASTLEEFEVYVWAKSPDGRPVKEEPVKVNDHGMDAMRYAVEYVDRSRGPEPTLREKVETRVAEKQIPVFDLTSRHIAYEQARDVERKKAQRPKFNPVNYGRLRRLN